MNQSYDYIVPPLRWKQIEILTNHLRDLLGFNDEPWFPVVDVIEKIMDVKLEMVRFEVGTKEEMQGAEGLTCPEGEFIQWREDVYRGACNGAGRHRFTAAHELGHFFLHTGRPLTRIPLGKHIPV